MVSCYHSTQPLNWRTTSCHLFTAAFQYIYIYPPATTWGSTMPWWQGPRRKTQDKTKEIVEYVLLIEECQAMYGNLVSLFVDIVRLCPGSFFMLSSFLPAECFCRPHLGHYRSIRSRKYVGKGDLWWKSS